MFNLEFFQVFSDTLHIYSVSAWAQFLWAGDGYGHVLLLDTSLDTVKAPGPCNFSGKLPE